MMKRPSSAKRNSSSLSWLCPILALHDAKPNNRVVDFAERLVVPQVFAVLDERGDVDDCEMREGYIQEFAVG